MVWLVGSVTSLMSELDQIQSDEGNSAFRWCWHLSDEDSVEIRI